MVSVPGFLLRRLYVKESLKNGEVGYEFQLKNGLGSGYAKRMLPIAVDGEEIAADRTFFVLDGQETAFDSIFEESPFTLPMNKAIDVWVDGDKLQPGSHRIEMGFEVPGLGTLKFDFTDIVADE